MFLRTFIPGDGVLAVCPTVGWTGIPAVVAAGVGEAAVVVGSGILAVRCDSFRSWSGFRNSGSFRGPCRGSRDGLRRCSDCRFR